MSEKSFDERRAALSNGFKISSKQRTNILDEQPIITF